MPSKASSSSKKASTSKSSKSSKSKSSYKSTTNTSKSSKKTDTTKRSSTTTKTPFSERSESDQKLLLHQTAALLQFLERQGLQKSVAKLKTGLKKDLGAKFVGDDDDEDAKVVFPEQPKGEWQFTKFLNYSSSEEEEEESSSSEYESSSSEEESSSSGEYESSSDEDEKSEYEEDMTDEEDDDKKKPAAAAKKKKTPPTRSKSFDADASQQRSSSSPQRGVRRAVSFTDDKPTFHTIPKPSTDDKKRLYYDKHDIRRMRKEDAQEKQLETERKLKEAMAMASSTMGGVWLPGMKL